MNFTRGYLCVLYFCVRCVSDALKTQQTASIDEQKQKRLVARMAKVTA